MFRVCSCLLALALPLTVFAAPPLSLFAAKTDFYDVTISPDGAHIAAKTDLGRQTALVLVPLADPKKAAKILPFGFDASVENYQWTGPNRVVIAVAMKYGSLDEPQLTGELYAVDADGKNATYLFGYRAPEQVGSHIGIVVPTRASATVVRTLPDDPHHVIIAVDDWENTADSADTHSYRLNVDNGILDHPDGFPKGGDLEFLADATGALRYAAGLDADHFLRTYYRAAEKSDWIAVNSGKLKDAKVIPLQISPDGSRAYLKSNEGEERYCLVEENLLSGERRRMSCDDVADLDHVIWSLDRSEPIAAVYANDRTSVRLVDTKHADRDKFAALQKAFGDRVVEVTSTTQDGKKAIVVAYSDRDPGEFFLFDTQSMHAERLFDARAGVFPEDMLPVRPISFKARDGQIVHGYLTLPSNAPKQPLPMVVNPHGGPLGHADKWVWDPEVQMLASRGYAVLQINFRGSSGYGESFYAAGIRAYDTVMIDDITDGARWAVAQGIADGKRLCIYGGSYGGFAALESAVREPDLYRCAVGYAGVYDWNLLKSSNGNSDTHFSRTFFDQFIGDSPQKLAAASPLSAIDKLRAAVMIIHGESDDIVPVNQAKALRKALDDRKYPYELLIKPGEGHGFFLPENREELYTRLLAFLDRNIGTAAAGNDASAASGDPAPKP